MAGLVALFSTYPDSVLAQVTAPATGLPARHKFLPSLAEIKEFCELCDYPRRRAAQRVKQIEPPELPRAERPTYDELKAKYGANWGISKELDKPKPLTAEQIITKYNITREDWDAIPDAPERKAG